MPITGPLKIAPAPTGNGNGNGNGGGGGKKWRAVGQAVSTDSTTAAAANLVVDGAVAAVSTVSISAAVGSSVISCASAITSPRSTSAAITDVGEAEAPQQEVVVGSHETLSTVDIGYLLTYDPIQLPLLAISCSVAVTSSRSKFSRKILSPAGSRSAGSSPSSSSRAICYAEDEAEALSILALAA